MNQYQYNDDQYSYNQNSYSQYQYNYDGRFCDPFGKTLGMLISPAGHTGLNNLKFTTTPCQPGLSIFEFTPDQSLFLEEQVRETGMYMLSFCLGAGIEWSNPEERGRAYSLERNESYIMRGTAKKCVSQYEGGQYYLGVGISFHPASLQGVAECLDCEKAVNDLGEISGRGKSYTITPHVAAILSQMLDSKVCDGLKVIYYQGKILELIAVYLDEMVCRQRDEVPDIAISKEDMFALRQAKDILDKTFVDPLTLTQLSRKVYLNEYKLKTGFKKCFGQTVYSYVLDKRMELALVLLEQRRYKIGDIAGLVGYANTSHFIAAFHKKYGFTPGEYARK